MKHEGTQQTHRRSNELARHLNLTLLGIALLAANFSHAATPAPGTKLWEFQTDGEIYSSPAIAPDGTIYFGSRDHKLYALTPGGKKKWEFSAAERIDAAPAIGPDGTIYVGSYDTVYFGCNDKKLYAVAGASGIGTAAWPMYRRDARHTGALPAPTPDHASLGVTMYAGLVINGSIGSSYRVEYTDRLSETWSAVGTVVLDHSPFLFIDAGSPNSTKRFYRAILLP